MNLFDFLILGIIAGITPGPITALMLGETFKHSRSKAIQVPFALLFSNLIVAPLAITILFWGSKIDFFLKIMTYLGAFVLIFNGFKGWKSSGEMHLKTDFHPFKKALLLDMVNPHPYIFWFTILAPPIILAIKNTSIMNAFLLWIIFVSGLIGTKILIIIIADKIKPILKPHHLKFVHKILAILLVLFGIRLLY